MVVKFIFSFAIFSLTGLHILAQQETREELEKQRAQLKKEVEQTQKLLNTNKAKTKETDK